MSTEEQPANLDIMKEQVLDLVFIMKILGGYKFISLFVFFLYCSRCRQTMSPPKNLQL